MIAESITRLFDLTDHVALVTGGAMGIGQAIAERLADAGAAVMIADINEPVAQQTAGRIVERGGMAAAIRADVGRVADATPTIETTLRTFGRVDILVNNAGIFPFVPALEMTEQQWDRVLGLNLKGAFFLAQAAAKRMNATKQEGAIINIASIDALHPTGNLAHYDASKGGLVMLTKSLAREWAPYHIRVNAIAPGSIATPGAQAGSAMLPPIATREVADLTASFMTRIPLGRMGEPADIANAALFLASQASSYMTGSVLVVDGGYLLS